jgi:uncharacterized protein (DUF433 family)
MSSSTTNYKYISLDENNVPYIEGTTMKVVEIVMTQNAYGWTPEEIQINHRYLSMSQILAALTYYWDHKQALDADIERRETYVQNAEQAAGQSMFVAKLKARGLLNR